MYDKDFLERWKSAGLAETLVPQACFMGFKACIIKDFFKLWQSHWNKWITPKPFAEIPDPRPNFIGSAFCCEQYALGCALAEFTSKFNKNIFFF